MYNNSFFPCIDSPVLIPVDPLPIWIVIVPPIAGLICALIVFIVIILIYISWKKRKRKKLAVHPVEGIDGESRSESKKSSMIDGEFELTRAKSRTLVIPHGTVHDMYDVYYTYVEHLHVPPPDCIAQY